MCGSIECTERKQPPLRVLTEELSIRLRVFNQAARVLQQMGIRLHRIAPVDNRLEIGAEDGRRLLAMRVTEGYQRTATAGSTRYSVQFQGVGLEWREPISASNPSSYAPRHH